MSHPTVALTAELSPGSILVIDDEPGVLLTIQAILMREGYQVDSAPNGSAAIEKIRQKTYDLVLTDLRLGDIDGLEVLAELRKRSTRTVAIVLTGYASLESAIEAMREGAYDYLVKPTDVEELKLRVAHVFERHRLTDELAQRVQDLEAANTIIDRMNANLREQVEEQTHELRARVTELDEAKTALEEAQAQRERFTAMVAHELRAPLTPVRIATQLIARQPDVPDRIRAHIASIEENIARLERLIVDLLDVSRIDKGNFRIEPAECDITALTRQTAEDFALAHADRHFVIEVPAEPVYGLYDRGRIVQALSNLIENAVKYSYPQTTITISLVVTDQGEAEIAVADEGMGIPQDKLQDLFKAGKRLPGSEGIQGYGLGLYITKGIAEAHGGYLRVESGTMRAQGATFTLVLPEAVATGLIADSSTGS